MRVKYFIDIILIFISLSISAAGENCIIKVEFESGLPVPGAHVYNHGIELGITGSSGIISIPKEKLCSDPNILGRIAAITACYRGTCEGGDTHGGGEYFDLFGDCTKDPMIVKISDGCGFHSPENLEKILPLLGKFIPPVIGSCPEKIQDSISLNLPTTLSQIKLDGGSISVGAQITDRSVAFKAKISNNNGGKLRLQVELRRLDEYGGQFDDSKSGLKSSTPVERGNEAIAYAHELIDGYYHWRARVIDESGKTSDWTDFGKNPVSSADFIVYSNTIVTSDESLDLDLTIYDGNKNSTTAILPGVLINGYDGKGNEFTKTTDISGLTFLKGSPGTWRFEASKDGYETRNWDWEITASGSMRYFLFKSQTPKIEDIGFYIIFHEDSLNGPELPGVRITGHDGAGKGFDKTANNIGQVGLPLEGSPGIWHFEASKDGYQSKIWDLEITGGGETRYAFLTKIAAISPIDLSLTVHEGSIYGQILPGIRVNGHDGAGKNFDQITNTNGVIVLKGSPGTWHFEASMDGYQTNSWDQEIVSSASRHAFLVKITERPPPSQESMTLYLTVHEGSIHGQTLSGVRVTGHDGAGKNFDQITRSGPIDGIVILTGSPGTWHFEASMDGYQTNTWDQVLVSSASRDAFLIEQNQDIRTSFSKGDRVRTTSDKKLNVRTGPGTDSPSIGTMAKGSIGTIIEGPIFTDGLYWWKVEYDSGITGWSSGKWLDLSLQIQAGCHEDPVTGQTICMDDASVFSQNPPDLESANEAATYCLNQGYNYQNGQCIFPDGSSCDAGAYYRGECNYDPQPADQPPIDQLQAGCHEDPVTGQMICVDDFNKSPGQQSLVGPAPTTYPAYGY